MAINKSFKRWLLAFILVIAMVIIFDWLFNHHRLQKSFLNKTINQRDTTK